jgi:hypothetical protein
MVKTKRWCTVWIGCQHHTLNKKEILECQWSVASRGGGFAIAFIVTKRCHIQSHLTACWTTSDQLSECSAIGTFS